MIRKGNNKFKTLHKGSELVTRVYKGDELIYQDIDALYSFKFTIDTRKNQGGGMTTDKTFSIYFYDLEAPRWTVPYDPVLIDWGDGTTTTTSNPSGSTSLIFSHTYDTAGEYQIKILPTVFVNGVPNPGWLSGLNLSSYDAANGYKVLSIDKILPEGSYNFSFHDNSRIMVRRCGRIFSLQNMRNLRHAPTDLLKNVNMIPVESNMSVYANGKFSNFAYYCGANISMADFDCDLIGILKTFLDKINPEEMARATNLGNCFDSTFNYAKIKKQIPADFFANIHTDSATNMNSMFRSTFAYSWNAGSENETIPAGLFDSIITRNATSVSYMFYETFDSAFYKSSPRSGSTTATIPDRLLPLDFSSATRADSLFESTFSQAFPVSASAAIPEHLFDGLKLPNITSAVNLFRFTFSGMDSSRTSIPETLFDNVTLSSNITNMSNMFDGTFQGLGRNATANTNTLPSGLFDFVSTVNATNLNQMFYRTFEQAYRTSTVVSIPSGLFNCLDLSSATNVQGLFRSTFEGFGANSQAANPIPADLFATVNTSGLTNLVYLFSRTFNGAFYNDANATIPEGLFNAIDTTNATTVVRSFDGTFGGFGSVSTVGVIPASLFSRLNFSNAVSLQYVFSATFYGYARENTSGAIPANLFSAISAPNGTNMSYMFNYTFYECFYKSTVITIPSGLFSALSTANVTNMSHAFEHTFYGTCRFSPNATIPSNLFSSVDTTNVTNFYNMFAGTFSRSFNPPSPVTIPSNLFSTIDTTNATNAEYMFGRTFSDTAITDVPQGIFGHLTIPASHNQMFYSTFGNGIYEQVAGRYVGTTLNDPFDGMSDFSWASASDTTAINSMFSNTFLPSRENTQWLIGSASTVLQHFNFTPNSDTNMFQNQERLTDYATINANWK